MKAADSTVLAACIAIAKAEVAQLEARIQAKLNPLEAPLQDASDLLREALQSDTPDLALTGFLGKVRALVDSAINNALARLPAAATEEALRAQQMMLNTVATQVAALSAMFGQKIDRSELIQFQQKILAEVQAKLNLVPAMLEARAAALPRPKDGEPGKDAHEWEFKVHPTQKGLLQFRRTDQEHWNTMDLRGASNNAPDPVSRYPTLFGGGGSAVDKKDLSSTHLGNTATKSRTYRVIGKAITTAGGQFHFDFDQAGLNRIYDASAKVFLLDDITLDPQERIVECFISSITNSSISGVAYFNQKTSSMLGKATYTKVPASAGLEVVITVEGD